LQSVSEKREENHKRIEPALPLNERKPSDAVSSPARIANQKRVKGVLKIGTVEMWQVYREVYHPPSISYYIFAVHRYTNSENLKIRKGRG